MYFGLTPSDIDRTHRIGQKKVSSKKSRAVFIKFAIIQEKYFFLKKKTSKRNTS